MLMLLAGACGFEPDVADGCTRPQDFCGKHNIVSDVEVINADYVNKAYERLPKNDVHYRFVIDVQGSMVQ